MVRTVDLEHRDRLLHAVTEDLIANGLVGASLDRLAVAAGTSARMLVHHFGSRATLIESGLQRAHSHQLAEVRDALPPDDKFLSHLAGAWPWFISARTRGFFRLSSQVASAALNAGDDAVRTTMASEWLELFQAGFTATGYRPAAARASATILAAQLRGLFLDLDATGDTARIRNAYHHFIRLFAQSIAGAV